MTSQIFALALGAAVTLGNAKTALMLIDVQDCFLEANTTSGNAGSLSVPASHIIPLINSIRESKSCLFDKVIRTQDYHPAKHISFASTHGLLPFAHTGGKGALPVMCITPTSGNTADASCCPTYYLNNNSRTDCDTVLCPPSTWDYAVNMADIITGNAACTQCMTNPSSCFSTTQAMWTDHCLQTGDSTFPPSLITQSDDIIVQKGGNQYVDAYSAFMDNTQNLKTSLDQSLQSEGINTLYVAGIATDVCVHATVRDALSSLTGNYTVKVITDATAAVLGNEANYNNAIAEMTTFGATMITTADVLSEPCLAASVSGAWKHSSLVESVIVSLVLVLLHAIA